MFGLEYPREEIDRAELHRWLDDLLDLREQTDPARPNDPTKVRFREATGKDGAADCAFVTCSLLFQAVAGWAVNHLIGRALPGAATRAPDAHDNERAGIEEYALRAGGWSRRNDETAKLDRATLRAVLRSPFQPVLPSALAFVLTDGLRALDFGEVHPIVRPTNRGLHGTFPVKLAEHRLEAVEYTHFMIGEGTLRLEAEKRTAQAYGVSESTVKAWGVRGLLKVYSHDEINEACDCAKRAGKLAVTLRDDPDYGDQSKGRTETFDGLVLHTYFRLRAGVSEAGRRYQQLLRAEQAGRKSPGRI